MISNFFYLRYLCLTLVFAFPANLALGSEARFYSFKKVLGIRPGISELAAVRKEFGDPDHELFSDGKSLTSSKSVYRIWQYNKQMKYQTSKGQVEEFKATKLSISISENSQKVISIFWVVEKDEPESDIRKAISQFSGANFTQKKQTQICDYFPDEVSFSDRKSGVSIVWLQSKNQVKSISIGLPNKTRGVARNSKNSCRVWE